MDDVVRSCLGDASVTDLVEALGHRVELEARDYTSRRGLEILGEYHRYDVELRKIILSLRYIRNTHLPISWLPQELIAKILIHAISESWTAHDYIWIRYTHVCRYWRDAALAFPAVWSRISTKNIHLMQMSLERSGETAITIHIVPPPWEEGDFSLIPSHQHERRPLPSKHEFISCLSPHFPRAVEVECIFSSSAHTNIQLLSVLSDLDASNMERLQMTIHKGNFLASANLPIVFRNKFPRTKSIDMGNFDVTGHPFVNLTSIALCRQPLRNSIGHRRVMSTFLDFLDQSPSLEFLSLAFTGPVVDDCRANRFMVLNHLRVLYLKDEAARINSLASHISFPNTTTVLLDYEQEDIPYFPKSLSHIIEGHISSPKLYLRRRYKSMVISIVSSEVAPLTIRLHPPLHHIWGYPDHTMPFVISIIQRLSPLPTALIRELWIDGDWYAISSLTSHRFKLKERESDVPWSNVLTQFPELRKLKIWSPVASIDILAALCAGRDGIDGVLCPLLDSLEILCLGTWLIASQSFVSLLARLIRERKFGGRPIKCVSIVQEPDAQGSDNESYITGLRDCVEIDEFVVLKERTPFEFEYAMRDVEYHDDYPALQVYVSGK